MYTNRFVLFTNQEEWDWIKIRFLALLRCCKKKWRKRQIKLEVQQSKEVENGCYEINKDKKVNKFGVLCIFRLYLNELIHILVIEFINFFLFIQIKNEINKKIITIYWKIIINQLINYLNLLINWCDVDEKKHH